MGGNLKSRRKRQKLTNFDLKLLPILWLHSVNCSIQFLLIPFQSGNQTLLTWSLNPKMWDIQLPKKKKRLQTCVSCFALALSWERGLSGVLFWEKWAQMEKPFAGWRVKKEVKGPQSCAMQCSTARLCTKRCEETLTGGEKMEQRKPADNPFSTFCNVQGHMSCWLWVKDWEHVDSQSKGERITSSCIQDSHTYKL